MEETRFLCDLPWKHLSVHPHGVCSVCCVANHAHGQSAASNILPDGGYEKINISEGIDAIVNSDSFREVRRQMVAGEVPPACKTCHDVELAGGKSKRQKESFYKTDVDKSTKSDGSISIDLMNVELRLGNYCNLKCRSCNAESSTSWIDDYKKLKDKIIFPSNYDELQTMKYTNYDWVEDEDFYDALISHSPRIDQLHISGGEPFLVPKHFKLLDKLIADGLAKDMKIFYITNANYDFEKIKPALDRLKHFQFVGISISVDDFGDRNDYIRKNANFKLTIDNIKKYITEYNDHNFYYTITQTINSFNFLYIEELTQYLVKRGMYKLDGTGLIKRIISNHVHAPEYQSANIIPRQFRRSKLDSIKGLVSDEFYNDIHGRYYNAEDNGYSDYFIKSTETLDKYRKESWKDTFEKLYTSLQKSPI
jgi:sulfatase maturation enzyme AslB (radical SAM superfamily)